MTLTNTVQPGFPFRPNEVWMIVSVEGTGIQPVADVGWEETTPPTYNLTLGFGDGDTHHLPTDILKLWTLVEQILRKTYYFADDEEGLIGDLVLATVNAFQQLQKAAKERAEAQSVI